MKSIVLAAVLLAPGCGSVLRAIAGPDPELYAAAPTIEAALDRDSAAHPEFKPANDDASDALDSALNPTFPPMPVPPIPGFPWLEPAALIVSSILGSLGARHVLKKREAKKAKGGTPA